MASREFYPDDIIVYQDPDRAVCFGRVLGTPTHSIGSLTVLLDQPGYTKGESPDLTIETVRLRHVHRVRIGDEGILPKPEKAYQPQKRRSGVFNLRHA